ncbi:MAG: dihydroorotase [Armatimonadetes bacterium]|nr:dihydroorotase [Armatimonadota bacterium]
MLLVLRGGRVIDPSRGVDEVTDVIIRNGHIQYIGPFSPPTNGSSLLVNRGQKEVPNSFPSQETTNIKFYDCAGLVITPGFIDMHVHLREPGFEHKETIATGTEAAAAGGFTTIVATPNTKPAVDNRAVVEYVLERGRAALVNVLTTGAATKCNEGAEMAEIGDMVEAGAVAISDDAFPLQSADLMRRVMEYAKMFNIPVLAHCEDKSMTRDAVMNEGVTCTVLGLRPWPRQAEEIMIWRNILLADLTGCALHVQHVTTAGGVEAIKWAKSRGIRVTCETCPQYFSLTDDALTSFDTNAKCNPPLRTQADVDAIKAGLADGTIDVIATDHAPHAREDKEVEMQEAAFGMVGLETALSLVITNLVKSGVLSIGEAIEKMTAAPARVLGLSSGALIEGGSADITVIDPEANVTIRSSEFKSLGRNTPFEGFELAGRVVATIVAGEVVSGELRCGELMMEKK